MNKIAIIHFLPIEMFPPTVNLLEELKSKNAKIKLYSCKNHKSRKEVKIENIKQIRFKSPAEKVIKKEISLIRHLKFNLITLYNLFIFNPDKILYYESFSAFPVYLYTLLSCRKTDIFIHCHEYYTQEWYKKQSKLLQFYHKLEKIHLFPKSCWISHTNAKRKELFSRDFPEIHEEKLRIVPNYPPKTWQIHSSKKKFKSPATRFVYIGTLSSDYSFIEEFCLWIKDKPNSYFDIYSYNIDKKAQEFFNQLQTNNIRFFKEGIEYNNIPTILSQYDIGLILYKALTVNFKYNATNKLFEYLACDLDVWFPKEMLGCYEYENRDTWPQVIKIDFKQLDSISLLDLNNKNLKYKPLHFWSENALVALINELTN
jgi:hypothetical protein